MKASALILALVLYGGASVAPAIADADCAAWCGDGKVWDEQKGECVVAPPKTS
jgi:hypothetical protein